MGRAKFHCAYCDRAFEDSQDARKRHFRGRNHHANVKLWFDSFADQDKKRAAAAAAQASVAPLPAPAQAPVALPPSMVPAPPEAFRRRNRLAEWG